MQLTGLFRIPALTLAVVIFVGIPGLAGQSKAHVKLTGLCKAVEQGNWKKAERKIQKLVNKWEYLDYSAGYPAYQKSTDSLLTLFKQLPCVSDAYADHCAMKLMIWPGHAVVGVQFDINGEGQEVCYVIQHGKMRSINLLGLIRIPLQGKEELVYMGSHSCPGFIQEQRALCEEENLKGL